MDIRTIIAKADEYFYKHDFEGAEKHLQNQYKLLVENNPSAALSIQSELVGLYRKLNMKDKGLISVALCDKLINELNIGKTAPAGDIYINCGTALTAFNMLYESYPYFEKARDIYNKVYLGDNLKKASLYNNWGLALMAKGDKLKAREMFQKSTYMLERMNNLLELAMSYISLADSYDAVENEALISSLMQKSYTCLTAKDFENKGYHAFVLSKCIPAFDYHGYIFMANNLKERLKVIDERY